jgi:hypothetical protein
MASANLKLQAILVVPLVDKAKRLTYGAAFNAFWRRSEQAQ